MPWYDSFVPGWPDTCPFGLYIKHQLAPASDEMDLVHHLKVHQCSRRISGDTGCLPGYARKPTLLCFSADEVFHVTLLKKTEG